MEEGLRNYYSGMADLMLHGMPTIECKKTVCEVLISAPGMSFKEVLGMKSTQPLAVPVGTQGTGAVSLKKGGEAEYMLSVKYARTTE